MSSGDNCEILERKALSFSCVSALKKQSRFARNSNRTKRNSAVLLCILLVGFLSGCRSDASRQPDPATLKIGAAEVDITPPVGFRMAGYFDERISTGIHDPLHAKALVFRQGNTQVALVCCELIGLSLNVSTNARALASRQTGIPVSHIIICANHTHTGPLFDDARRFYFHKAAVTEHGTDAHEAIDYPQFLIKQLAKSIAEAQASLLPTQLEIDITRQEGLTFNRRYWMKNGKVAFNPGQLNPNIVQPAGPTDPEVGILLARCPGAPEPFAGLTVFAMHSDTVGGTLYSADYAYFLQQTLRQAFGPNFVSAFGLGTCGDLNHINVQKKEPVTGFPITEHIGRTLGQAVLSATNALKTVSHPSLAVKSRAITTRLQAVTPEQLKDAHSMLDRLGDPNTDFYRKVAAVKILDLEQHGRTWPMEVQVIRLDANSAIVCLPGEIFVELGLAIKRQSPFKNTFVLSICNDRPSYVPTQKAFSEGSYEVSNSRVEPGTGEQLVGVALDLLRNLKHEQAPIP